ncbi:hypothetical protein WR25_11301 [Diploscapter pachys]|uniref:Trs120/TRAPPC9 first Ig-like domain-containing protein n=1 Tax=Diploscapter pachys TaxID=2018661 RepID=A0A2A2K8P8_9BILA|nr:hypothetical protein WR25_11301 [Diploscapter pachys]
MDSWTEYENVMKKALSYQNLRQYYQAEQYIRDHIGRYLDDQFKLFDHLAKSTICFNASSFYRQMGFKRKASFYDRLGVLFRLHVVDSSPRTPGDYKLVYPTLLKTLPGYGVGDTNLPLEKCPPLGPVQLQIRVLHELYTAANRAELPVVAIRHSCHLLQLYYDILEEPTRNRLLDDLKNLLQAVGGSHSLAEPAPAGIPSITLSPIQLTRFPIITEAKINRLSSALEPTIINLDEEQGPVIWIVSQFEKKKDDEICWAVDCPVEVSIQVFNCLPTELVVRNLKLLVKGCDFEAVPIHLTLSPSSSSQPITVELGGIPRSAGHLTIIGYSCEVFGLQNVCKLPGKTKMKVRVLPELPVLRMDSSLTRSLVAGMDDESREEKLYAGQTFEHTLSIVNSSGRLTVRKATLAVEQPKVCGTPLIEMFYENDQVDDLWLQSELDLGCLGPDESKQIKFRLFGLDPTRTAMDGVQEESVAESALPLLEESAETQSVGADTQHDLIPFHGRLLSCSMIVTYECDIEGDTSQAC